MVVIKRTVKKWANTGHVTMPKEHIGKEVWVVTDDTVEELQELIEVTLLYRKAYKYEQSEITKKLREFITKTENRLDRIEKIVIPY